MADPIITSFSVSPSSGPHGTMFNFSASAYDPDGSDVTYEWTILSPVNAPTFRSTPSFSLTLYDIGSWTVELVVRDGASETTSAGQYVVVNMPTAGSIKSSGGSSVGATFLSQQGMDLF